MFRELMFKVATLFIIDCCKVSCNLLFFIILILTVVKI